MPRDTVPGARQAHDTLFDPLASADSFLRNVQSAKPAAGGAEPETFGATMVDESSRFSMARISKRISSGSESLFSRKGSDTSTASLGLTGDAYCAQLDVSCAKPGFFNKIWPKRLSQSLQPAAQQQTPQAQPVPFILSSQASRIRSNSSPTSIHSNSTLQKPRKLSISTSAFKRSHSNATANSLGLAPSSRSSSNSISTNPDLLAGSVDHSSNPANITYLTPVRPALNGKSTLITNTIISTNSNTNTIISERGSPVDALVDISDEYFLRNPSMNEDLVQTRADLPLLPSLNTMLNVSPRTNHSSQFRDSPLTGWVLQDGVLVSQDDVMHNCDQAEDDETDELGELED